MVNEKYSTKEKNDKMGNLLSEPVINEEVIKESFNLINNSEQMNEYSSCSVSQQGYRLSMEDRILRQVSRDGEHLFLAVFDGHGGTEASDFTYHNFMKLLEDFPPWIEYLDQYQRMKTEELSVSMFLLKSKLTSVFESFMCYLDLAFFNDLKMEKNKLSITDHTSGTTAVIMIVNSRFITSVNLGDSKGLLIENGDIKFETEDHKPDVCEEFHRIRDCGGFVEHGRVYGNLALSRALGDFSYKKFHLYRDGVFGDEIVDNMGKQVVIPHPEICLIPNRGQEIIVASDGFWDVWKVRGPIELKMKYNQCFGESDDVHKPQFLYRRLYEMKETDIGIRDKVIQRFQEVSDPYERFMLILLDTSIPSKDNVSIIHVVQKNFENEQAGDLMDEIV